MTAFVAGATGYTGREIVRQLLARGEETIAHVRPNSSQRADFETEFGDSGLVIDTSEWSDDAIQDSLERHKPDLIFSVLGTTKARKSKADDKELETYHAVDYGLTVMLAGACVSAKLAPRFVYLSAFGVKEGSLSEYMRARWEAENYIRHSELPFTFIRPAFISGDDRSEFRFGERFGAVTSDALLSAAAAIGFKGLKKRFASMTAEQLAASMISAGFDPVCEGQILEPYELRDRI